MKTKDVELLNLNTQFFKFLNNDSSENIILKYYIHGDVHFNLEGHKLIFENLNKIIDNK